MCEITKTRNGEKLNFKEINNNKKNPAKHHSPIFHPQILGRKKKEKLRIFLLIN